MSKIFCASGLIHLVLLIMFMCIHIYSPFPYSQEKYMILFYKNIYWPNMVQIFFFFKHGSDLCNNGGSWSKPYDSSRSLLWWSNIMTKPHNSLYRRKMKVANGSLCSVLSKCAFFVKKNTTAFFSRSNTNGNENGNIKWLS